MNNPPAVNPFDFSDMVTVVNNNTITTSVKVAEYFGKRHKDVLRAIRNLKCSKEFNERNFAPVDFIDKKGEVMPMFNITRDGCMFLIMGFTGVAASAIKENYINAFNWMAEKLNRRVSLVEDMQHQYAIKETRSVLKGSIGSRLMCERKKEKRILGREHEQILKLSQPGLFTPGE